MSEKKIKVRIKPLHGIGGYGSAGDEVWMPEAEARYWMREGYVEMVKDEPPAAVKASAKPEDAQKDHAVMKPKKRRIG